MDKILHIIASALITLVAILSTSVLIGLIIGISAGLIKEFIWDLKLKKGQFDVYDIFANFFGVLVGAFIACLILFA